MSGPLDGKYIVRPNGCWEWQRAIQSRGYGSVSYQGKTHLAHRLSYQLSVGPVPDGWDVHHKCGNRRCVNPDHLQPLKRKLHFRLANTPFSRNADKETCERGHNLSGENLLIDSRKRRQCRTCVNTYQRHWRATHKEARHGH